MSNFCSSIPVCSEFLSLYRIKQDFSSKYLNYLDSLSEENQLNSAKSIEINQESDSLLIDSELLFKNEFSIDSAYSSEYCFTAEEIEEFTNEFETLTNLT